MVTTREVALCRRPRGRIGPDCFTLVERDLPAVLNGAKLGKALVRP